MKVNIFVNILRMISIPENITCETSYCIQGSKKNIHQ